MDQNINPVENAAKKAKENAGEDHAGEDNNREKVLMEGQVSAP